MTDAENASTAPDRAPRRRGGRLRLPVVALLVAALALWGSSRLTWLVVVAANDQSGEVSRSVGGAAWQPGLVPLAIVAVAAVAAAALARGVAARALGVVVLALGASAAMAAGSGFRTPDAHRAHEVVTADTSTARTNSGSNHGPAAIPSWSQVTSTTSRPAGPAAAAGGAVALLVAGASLALRPPERTRRDARYAAKPSDAPATGPERPAPAPEDVDGGRDLWDALDDGVDPTDGAHPPK